MKMTGAQIFLAMLKQEAVDTIFGFPGGVLLDIYDEIYKSDIRHILVRHEQGAVHAADGYARASGKVGVCLVTSGPGATNTVTGVATAYMDSIPMVVFTGQVPTQLIGNDAFQEVDIVGITRPCTKHNYLVKDTNDLARVVREAFHIARSGRPGPVLVDIPKNVANGVVEFNPEKNGQKLQMRAYNPTYEPNTRQLKKVVEMIRKAKRPVLFGGGGIILSGATEAFTHLGRHARIPVTASLMGLGGFPGSDPLWLGMPGMHGTFRANMSLGECDLLIGVGVRFDDRVTGRTDTFAPNAKIVHIDIDPTSIRKNVAVAVPVVGDCKISLDALNEMLDSEDLGDIEAARRPWLKQIEEWKSTQPLAYEQGERLIKPQFVVEKLFELTAGKAIITTEVGQNQMWAAQYYHFDKPNHFLTSGGLGTMGFGLPAAIGAQIAYPDKLVVDVPAMEASR
jgi:acetolactate synthase-1/2/3 large subunit